MDLEIAIVVVGGVSGAYSAWHLQEAQGGSDRIALFEYSDRIGGRLFTVTMPGSPHVKAEVGGMRYIKDQHPVITHGNTASNSGACVCRLVSSPALAAG